MAVLKGEGKFSILYGSNALPTGRTNPAYLSRPDKGGTFSTVIIAHGARGLTPHVKGLCRRLARYGYSVICPDLYRGADVDGADLDGSMEAFAGLPGGRVKASVAEAYDAAAAPGSDWASAHRVGVVAIGPATTGAVAGLAEIDTASALVVIGAKAEDVSAVLTESAIPVLGIYGGDEEGVDAIRSLRDESGRGEWLIYQGVAGEFLDEGTDGYDYPAADDALDRIVAFLDVNLGVAAQN